MNVHSLLPAATSGLLQVRRCLGTPCLGRFLPKPGGAYGAATFFVRTRRPPGRDRRKSVVAAALSSSSVSVRFWTNRVPTPNSSVDDDI